MMYFPQKKWLNVFQGDHSFLKTLVVICRLLECNNVSQRGEGPDSNGQFVMLVPLKHLAK